MVKGWNITSSSIVYHKSSDLKHNRLSSRSRAKFFAAIWQLYAQPFSAIKSFPTPHEYNHVGEQIVNWYPFLKSKSGSGYVRPIYM